MCAVTQHLLAGGSLTSGFSGFKSRLRLSYLSSPITWGEKRFPIFFANLHYSTSSGEKAWQWRLSLNWQRTSCEYARHSFQESSKPASMAVSHGVNYLEWWRWRSEKKISHFSACCRFFDRAFNYFEQGSFPFFFLLFPSFCMRNICCAPVQDETSLHCSRWCRNVSIKNHTDFANSLHFLLFYSNHR